MDVVTLNSQAAFIALKPHWDQLYAQANSASPFSSFHWIKLWMENLAPRSAFQQHTWHIVTVWHGDILVGAVPMLLTTYQVWGFPLLRYLRPIGSDANITEIKAPLIHPNHEAHVVKSIAAHFEDSETCYDLIRWPDLPTRHQGHVEQLNRYHHSTLDEYIVTTETSWESFRSKLKRNLKEAIRRSYNAPSRDSIDLSFAVIDDREEMLARLPEFFRLHGMRAQASSGPRHPNYFASAAAQAFISSFIRESDRVRPLLFDLRHGDRMVAARLGFFNNDALYFYFSGYDLSYARYSVMTRLVVEAIQFAIAQGIHRINLSTGCDQSKLRWEPDCLDYVAAHGWSRKGRGFVFSKLLTSGKWQRSPKQALWDLLPGTAGIIAGRMPTPEE